MANEDLTRDIQMRAIMAELLAYFKDDEIFNGELDMITKALERLNDEKESRRINGLYRRANDKYELFREQIKPSRKRTRKSSN